MSCFQSFSDRQIFGRALYPILPLGETFIPDDTAINFINTVGITDATQQAAITKLIYDLKDKNLWNKMIAIYPFIGGTATTHKYNLKDIRDSDSAYRLNFVGGWTHSTTGGTPNGTNGYADTFIIPITALNSSNFHLSLYSRTNNTGQTYDMGSGNNAGTRLTDLFLRRTGDGAGFDAGAFTSNRNTFTNTNSTGFYIGSVIVNTESKYYKNGTNQNTKALTAANLNLADCKMLLGGANVTELGPSFFSSKEIAFASIGQGLSDSEALDYYNLVQTYQTTLSRQV